MLQSPGVDELPARLPQYAIMLAAVALTLAVVAFALLYSSSRQILRPLAGLVQTTEQIARNGDYSARAVVRSDDELGRLSRSFNQMIEVIGQRDGRTQQFAPVLHPLAGGYLGHSTHG